MGLKGFLTLSFTQVFGHLHHASNNGEGMATKEEGMKMIMGENYPAVGFQMPLHYPRYAKWEYETMEEWRLDLLLREYGLCSKGAVEEKRAFAMGAFLWPDQL